MYPFEKFRRFDTIKMIITLPNLLKLRLPKLQFINNLYSMTEKFRQEEMNKLI